MVGGEISFGRFRLDLARRELRRDNSLVRLGSRALDILCVLASAKGAIITKDELMARVWSGVVVEENNIQVHISALRKALEEGGNDESSIVTVPGRGYRLIRPPEPLAADKSAPGPGVPLTDRPSVAVLPFQNMSGDPEQEYFADGMVEEIITALSRIRWLFVTARNSTFAYKGQNVDVKGVGRELGVRYVLEGSVRKGGNRVRITAQLIDTGTGAHLWADRFDGPLEDVFDLQDKVASSVAGVIEPALQAAEAARSAGRPTDDLTAYDLYLRAYAMVWSSARQIPEALRLLELAIARDPSYGPTLAWAAYCCVRLLRDERSEDRDADSLKGADFARRALEVAGDDPGILANAAQALAYLGEDIGAMMVLVDRAVTLNPSFARGWHISGTLRDWAGQPEIAIEHAETALRLSPCARVGPSLLVIGAAHFYSRRFDEAVPKLLVAIQEDPSFPAPYRILAACYAHMGRLDDARETIIRLQAITRVVIPDASYLRNAEHRELFLSGLRLATGKSRSIDAMQRHGQRLLRSSEPPAGDKSDVGPSLPLPDKPSIAVLPFQNMSGEPEQEYFADGMVEEIITALSHFRSLFVVSRNSSFTYKGKPVDVKQVGRQLGVRYVLEGSVRKAGDRVRITGQLIDASTDAHLWADRFEGTLKDIFGLQDQVCARVVGAIVPRLEQAEIERVKRKPTQNLDAYDYYLRGIAALNQFTSREANIEALQLFKRAIELDRDFASAYGMAAHCYVPRKANDWMADSTNEMVEAAKLAQQATELGGDDALALTMAGTVLAYVVRDLNAGGSLIDRALALNENLALAWFWGGYVKLWLGEPDAALERFAHVVRLSPVDPYMSRVQAAIADAHFHAERYGEASSWAAKSLQGAPFHNGLRISAASNALAGRLEQAQTAVARLRHLDPELRVSTLRNVQGPYRRPEELARYEKAMRIAGLPE
jgi:TolB-like protein/predicted Zn-dependent protease